MTFSFQYYAWRVANAALSRLPLSLSYGIATGLGTAAFMFWPRGRRNTLRNHGRVLRGQPRAAIERAARASLVNYCHYLVDFIRFPGLSPADFLRLCHGEAEFGGLDDALARGKGVIFVPMHFGNWDIGAAAAAAHGYRPTVVAETFPDPRLDAMVFGARERLGMTILRAEKAGPALIRILRGNGVLALLIDRPQPGVGVGVTFFGAPVAVPAGPARLALATGATVVPIAFPRLRRGQPDVAVIAEFLVPAPSGDRAADVQALTQEILAAHERFINAYPEQWYMFREMWPRTMAGERQ